MDDAKSARGHALITGGAGFVGANLAHRLLSLGQRVVLLDNLARPGVERNVEWLESVHGRAVEFVRGDCRDGELVTALLHGANQVYHFAAQVAVTTSLVTPLEDFEVNARGTLQVLEALRSQPVPPPLVFTSTNKVYGALPDVALVQRESRYEPALSDLAGTGVGEWRPLDFHSPYGCSKGAADQYVIDYARTFGLPTVVFRMSCIYGPRQFGTEDQGWVAHFLIRALRDEAITIYGDGLQVRDILFVDDLVDAFLLARDRAETLAGSAFNIGGGPRNTVSLMELLERIARMTGKRPEVRFEEARVGDQRYYVSDTSAFKNSTGWVPRVGVEEGLGRLREWLEHPSRSETKTRPARVLGVAPQGAG